MTSNNKAVKECGGLPPHFIGIPSASILEYLKASENVLRGPGDGR